MPISARHPLTDTYRMEVSGWDHEHTFFVEKAELEWSEGQGKRISLTRALRPGTMIFLRLLQATSPERAFPVAYEAEETDFSEDGSRHFRLRQVQPKSGLAEALEEAEEFATTPQHDSERT